MLRIYRAMLRSRSIELRCCYVAYRSLDWAFVVWVINFIFCRNLVHRILDAAAYLLLLIVFDWQGVKCEPCLKYRGISCSHCKYHFTCCLINHTLDKICANCSYLYTQWPVLSGCRLPYIVAFPHFHHIGCLSFRNHLILSVSDGRVSYSHSHSDAADLSSSCAIPPFTTSTGHFVCRDELCRSDHIR